MGRDTLILKALLWLLEDKYDHLYGFDLTMYELMELIKKELDKQEE